MLEKILEMYFPEGTIVRKILNYDDTTTVFMIFPNNDESYQCIQTILSRLISLKIIFENTFYWLQEENSSMLSVGHLTNVNGKKRYCAEYYVACCMIEQFRWPANGIDTGAYGGLQELQKNSTMQTIACCFNDECGVLWSFDTNSNTTPLSEAEPWFFEKFDIIEKPYWPVNTD